MFYFVLNPIKNLPKTQAKSPKKKTNPTKSLEEKENKKGPSAHFLFLKKNWCFTRACVHVRYTSSIVVEKKRGQLQNHEEFFFLAEFSIFLSPLPKHISTSPAYHLEIPFKNKIKWIKNKPHNWKKNYLHSGMSKQFCFVLLAWSCNLIQALIFQNK